MLRCQGSLPTSFEGRGWDLKGTADLFYKL